MRYEKAQNILPEDMIKALQQYVDGAYLYIPRKESHKKSWGEESGVKSELASRNGEIYQQFLLGTTVKELASSYYLSQCSIRRIIRKYKSI